MSRVAVLGPQYSYSHLAAMKLVPEYDIFFCDKIEKVFQRVMAQQSEQGIIPIENMLHGSVRESIMGLLKYDVKINKAYNLPIHFCLAAQENDYKVIGSKLEALAQCSIFLTGKNTMEYPSTAEAMKIAAYDPNRAAIGSREAAERYHLRILHEDIEDNHDNVTRFFAISLEETTALCEKSRTSLLLRPKKDCPGLLFHLLAPFAVQNINLLKIESLPTGKKMEEYVFYVEIKGNVQEEKVKSALDFLRNSIEVYPLGSYQVLDLK